MMTALTSLLGTLAVAGTPGIRGDYVEARTADIYTGPCFSNSEIFNVGDRAVLAWKVTEGTYQGQDLAGLSVVAAVKGTTTFTVDDVKAARAVLIVDQRATPEQKAALVAFAKEMGGERLKTVAEIRSARIGVTVETHEPGSIATETAHDSHHMAPAPRASVWVSGLAEILTRPMEDTDHFCGNERVEYPPLSKGVQAVPAYTLAHTFKGKALEATWDDPNCRSSFVGHFAN